jgi:hypothetical protein
MPIQLHEGDQTAHAAIIAELDKPIGKRNRQKIIDASDVVLAANQLDGVVVPQETKTAGIAVSPLKAEPLVNATGAIIGFRVK